MLYQQCRGVLPPPPAPQSPGHPCYPHLQPFLSSHHPASSRYDAYGEEMDSASDEQSSSCSSRQTDSRTLLQEARSECDSIRFSTYRCAAKLRYIQKRTNLHLIDIWNVIEAFRENGLNALEPRAEVTVTRLDALLTSLCLALNKRLPLSHQVNLDAVVNTVLSLLLSVYDPDELGAIRVFSVKVALSTLCSGKVTDKLRYIFSQLSDTNGHLLIDQFNEYLREVLALPAAVSESNTFYHSDSAAQHIFPSGPVDVNEFLSTLLTEPGAECLLWLPVLHRMATVEAVYHNVQCAGCERAGFTGFKYRCERCSSYQLCQGCFWRGRTSGAHTLQHPMKEFLTPKSPPGRSIRSSFRCVPEQRKSAASVELSRYPSMPDKPYNMMHIVPPSPLLARNGSAGDGASSASQHLAPPFRASTRAPSILAAMGSVSSPDSLTSDPASYDPDRYSPSRQSLRERHVDEEHRLIARYTARLANESTQGRSSSDSGSCGAGGEQLVCSQREAIVAQLEAKNQEMIRQISRLRAGAAVSVTGGDLMTELHALRERRGQLECHLTSLQDSRRHLMTQLDSLMKLLKNQQMSPGGGAASRGAVGGTLPRTSKSAPNTPGSTLRRHRVPPLLHHQTPTSAFLASAGGLSPPPPAVASASSVGGASMREEGAMADPFSLGSGTPGWAESTRWQGR